MSTELNLLPCPFCESDNLSIDTNCVMPDDYHDAWVRCDDCDAEGRHAMTLEGWLSSKDEAKAEAVVAWNRRASPSAAVPEGALPPLPPADVHDADGPLLVGNTAYSARLVQAYARAAVEADRAQQGEPHDDDIAWEHFASATKAKMAEGREKGRGGWEDPEQCPTERLQLMLLEHLKKGDPVDVANFCMMLWTRGEPVVAVDLKAARQAVLEDAAAICDNFAKRDMHPAECAGAIRMMKDSIK